jgi:hypothetical protein
LFNSSFDKQSSNKHLTNIRYNILENKFASKDKNISDYIKTNSLILSLNQQGKANLKDETLALDNSANPKGSPLGTIGGKDWIRINAGYKDPSYKDKFKIEHEALDIVPNSEYQKNNNLYLSTGMVMLYSTCSGQGSNQRSEEQY